MTEPGAAQPTPSDSKPEAKTEPKPEAKSPSDFTAQIAKRSYELYEEGGRQDGRAVQDWEKAERAWTSGATLAAAAELLVHDSQYSAAEYPDHCDTDLDRLMAEAIEEAKPGYQVTPGIEGTVFEL